MAMRVHHGENQGPGDTLLALDGPLEFWLRGLVTEQGQRGVKPAARTDQRKLRGGCFVHWFISFQG